MSESIKQGDYYILFVDDEEKTRKAFKRLFEDEFKILLASDGAEGYSVFEKHKEIGVIVTDQKMPRETGVQFLSRVAEIDSQIVRVLSTAYAELDAAIAGVNEAGIYRYVTKPWDVAELEITLRRAMELFLLRKDNLAGGSGGPDTEKLLMNQRVASLAFAEAVARAEMALSVTAGATFLNFLGMEGLVDDGEVDWASRYNTQLDFFEGVCREVADSKNSEPTLDWARTAPPSMAIQAAAVGCEGLKMVGDGNDASVWPGPAPVLSGVLRSLMIAFSDMLGQLPDSVCEVKANFNTVDFIFNGTPLKNGLLQLATRPEDSEVLRNLLRACLMIEHEGGTLSFIPNEGGLYVRLGFEEQVSGGNSGLAVVQRLTGFTSS